MGAHENRQRRHPRPWCAVSSGAQDVLRDPQCRASSRRGKIAAPQCPLKARYSTAGISTTPGRRPGRKAATVASTPNTHRVRAAPRWQNPRRRKIPWMSASHGGTEHHGARQHRPGNSADARAPPVFPTGMRRVRPSSSIRAFRSRSRKKQHEQHHEEADHGADGTERHAPPAHRGGGSEQRFAGPSFIQPCSCAALTTRGSLAHPADRAADERIARTGARPARGRRGKLWPRR